MPRNGSARISVSVSEDVASGSRMSIRAAVPAGVIRNPDDCSRIPSHRPARRVSEADFRIAKRSRRDRLKRSTGNRMNDAGDRPSRAGGRRMSVPHVAPRAATGDARRSGPGPSAARGEAIDADAMPRSGLGPDRIGDSDRAERLRAVSTMDDLDRLAGEFALGLLEAAERLAVEERRGTEPDLDAAILAWERRLAALGEALPPRSPGQGPLSRDLGRDRPGGGRRERSSGSAAPAALAGGGRTRRGCGAAARPWRRAVRSTRSAASRSASSPS